MTYLPLFLPLPYLPFSAFSEPEKELKRLYTCEKEILQKRLIQLLKATWATTKQNKTKQIMSKLVFVISIKLRSKDII